jgi:hypothetical protein
MPRELRGRNVKRRLKLSFGAFVMVAVSSWGAVATASTPSTSASQLVALAIHDAEGAGWVHETTNASGSGLKKFSMVNDIGATEGRQVIVSDGAHATVLVIGGDAFIYGNAKAVANYFEISTTQPQKYANQWLELTPSSPDFSTVSSAVTLESDFSHLEMPGSLREGSVVTINGQRARSVSAHVPATSQSPAGNVTLYITTSGEILPVEYRAVAKGVKSTTTWSHWGRVVTLVTPSAALGSS